jgi:hypothetical protein
MWRTGPVLPTPTLLKLLRYVSTAHFVTAADATEAVTHVAGILSVLLVLLLPAFHHCSTSRKQ